MREERAIDLCKGDVSTSLNMTAMKRGSFGGEEWAIELCKGDSSTALRMTGKMRVGRRVKTFGYEKGATGRRGSEGAIVKRFCVEGR